MVDLKTISLEHLTSLINLYPWFAAARKELGNRTGKYTDAALYVFDRRILTEAQSKTTNTYVDTSVETALKAHDFKPLEQQVIVLGGDYFSQDAYNSIRTDEYQAPEKKSEDVHEAPAVEIENNETELVTETLAQIYAQQGYPEIAKDIYSKLILRYPEKSVYFATLIENLNIINNQ